MSMYKTSGFMGSCENFEEAEIVLTGVPMDYTCSFKAGTRYGYQKIRDVSYGIEEFSYYAEKSLEDVKYFDMGELDLPFNTEKALDITGKSMREILSKNKFPIFIGGEHLITLPLVREIKEKYDDFFIVHFDAHADLREDYLGEKLSHASVIRRICDFVCPENIFQFGIRSGTKEELEFARNNTRFFPFEVLENLRKNLDILKTKPIYLTIDIDVCDPAFANGTGTPEPGGITSRELFDSLKLFCGLDLIGFDLVEVSPYYDNSDRTAILAAKIIREIILLKSKL